jgi:hypothetical protein
MTTMLCQWGEDGLGSIEFMCYVEMFVGNHLLRKFRDR